MHADDAPNRRLQTLARHLAQQQAPTPPAPAAPTPGPQPQPLPQVQLQRAATSASGGAGGWFAGKAVLITGAAKGIGEAAAHLFAQHGASLVVSDLDAAALERTAADVRARWGARVAAVPGDVTAPDAARALVAAAREHYGRLDVLVNNAGYTWDGVLHKMGDKQWQAMLDVHVTAPFRLVQAAAPLMRDAGKAEAEEPGGAAPRSIINITSVSGTHGNAGQANYSAAKAGVVGLTKTIAKEWGHFNVRCNAVAYGWIDTRLTRPKEEGGEAITVGGEKVALGIPGGDALRDLATGTIPLGRVGTAEEAAGVILLLASPWASYITGQVLEVNGGSYM